MLSRLKKCWLWLVAAFGVLVFWLKYRGKFEIVRPEEDPEVRKEMLENLEETNEDIEEINEKIEHSETASDEERESRWNETNGSGENSKET